jgi:glucoamylase
MEVLSQHVSNFLSSNSTAIIQPAMQFLSSALILGSFAFQVILGYPEAVRVRREGELLKRSVDTFIATESPIALQVLLCNIGSTGCNSAGVSSGVVIASPDKANPDCELHGLFCRVKSTC